MKKIIVLLSVVCIFLSLVIASLLGGMYRYTKIRCSEAELLYIECHSDFLRSQNEVIKLKNERDRISNDSNGAIGSGKSTGGEY